MKYGFPRTVRVIVQVDQRLDAFWVDNICITEAGDLILLKGLFPVMGFSQGHWNYFSVYDVKE